MQRPSFVNPFPLASRSRARGRRIRLLLTAAFLLFLPGCPGGGGDDTPEDGGGSDVVFLDVFDAAPPATDANDGGDPSADGADGSGGPDVSLAGFLDPCSDNADCASGWCVADPEGAHFCTRRCEVGCPDDWLCRSVRGTGPDFVLICTPRADRLCEPCGDAEECGGGACLDLDDGPHCSQPCDSGEDCPSGFDCQEQPSRGPRS